jgi:uracil DNA glycosylase
LTVERGKPGSHSDVWREFTDALILVATGEYNPVFLLWGAHALEKRPIITAVRGADAYILTSSHPAPPACYRRCGDSRPFVDSRPFSNPNKLLKTSGRDEIDWNLS